MAAISAFRCALLAAVVVPLAAETLDEVNDIRLGISAVPVPYVSETLSDASGSSRYTWKNNGYPGHLGARYEIGWWHGSKRSATSSVTSLWMIGLNYSSVSTTPDSYDIGSGTAINNRQDLSTRFQQAGIALGYGLKTNPTDTFLGDLHGELLPILRGGWGQAETVSPGANPITASGTGFWWEAALEGGLVLTADEWLVNPFIGVAYGQFTTSIDLPNNTTSDLTITTLAPQLGIRVGARF